MRANTTIKLLRKVAIITQYLKSLGVLVCPEPRIDMGSASCELVLSAMFSPIVIDMVNTQKSLIIKSATSASTAITGHNLMAEFDSPAQVYSFSGLGMCFEPLGSISGSIVYKPLTIALIILAAVLAFSLLGYYPFFWS